MSAIVLLLAPEAPGLAAADALRRALDAEVDLRPAARDAMTTLRTRSYTLILVDEAIASAEPEMMDRLYQDADAPLLELNFVLSSAPRIVRQARAALARRSRDLALAQTAAATLLHGELKQTLAGLLLESELALRKATPEQEPHLRGLVQLASNLREQLRSEMHTVRPSLG